MAAGAIGLFAQNLVKEDYKVEHAIAIIPHHQEKERTAKGQEFKKEVVQMNFAKV